MQKKLTRTGSVFFCAGAISLPFVECSYFPTPFGRTRRIIHHDLPVNLKSAIFFFHNDAEHARTKVGDLLSIDQSFSLGQFLEDTVKVSRSFLGAPRHSAGHFSDRSAANRTILGRNHHPWTFVVVTKATSTTGTAAFLIIFFHEVENDSD